LPVPKARRKRSKNEMGKNNRIKAGKRKKCNGREQKMGKIFF